MKKMNATIDRLGTASVTPNHQKTYIMNFELDYSYGELFALTVTTKQNNRPVRTIFCRNMRKNEMHTSGLHFNTIQPDHKLRFNEREWTKAVNSLLAHLRLEIPEVTKCKKN